MWNNNTSNMTDKITAEAKSRAMAAGGPMIDNPGAATIHGNP